MNPRGQKGALQKTSMVRLSRDEHGASVIEVDTAQFPPANRKLACNAVDAKRRDGSIELTFAQCLPGTAKSVAAMVVSVAPIALQRALRPSSEFLRKLSEFLEQEHMADVDSGIESYNERIVFERAAALSIAHVGHDAEIRFFAVRAGVFVRMQAANEWNADFIEPLVDVALSAALLKCLIVKISAVVPLQTTEMTHDRR